MARSRVAAVCVVAAATVLASGCATIFKDDYWSEVHRQSDEDALARLRDDTATVLYLGVRAPAREEEFQVGIPVQHVYAESPAARAGLRPGDEIRAIGGHSVRTPGDARWVLSVIWAEVGPSELVRREALSRQPDAGAEDWIPRATTKLVYARDGREIGVTVDLTSREGYSDLRRRRVLEQSRYEERGANGFGFRKRRTVPIETINAYFGVLVPRDVKIAQDTDVLPIALGISLVRIEKIHVADAFRFTLICSLFQFSMRGEDVAATLRGLIPDPPPGTTDI